MSPLSQRLLQAFTTQKLLWRVLGSGEGCCWGTGECLSCIWRCIQESWGVLGRSGGVRVPLVNWAVFHSISVNTHYSLEEQWHFENTVLPVFSVKYPLPTSRAVTYREVPGVPNMYQNVRTEWLILSLDLFWPFSQHLKKHSCKWSPCFRDKCGKFREAETCQDVIWFKSFQSPHGLFSLNQTVRQFHLLRKCLSLQVRSDQLWSPKNMSQWANA